MSDFPTTNPKVLDANGSPIDFQGVQKVRNYEMPFMAIRVLDADGDPFLLTRAIVTNAAGTATITDATGTTITNFPLEAGRNNLAITAIEHLSGISTVWGLY